LDQHDIQMDLFPNRLQLESREAARNRFRFYEMVVERDLFGTWCLVRRWGRIGTRGRARTDLHRSPEEALDSLADLAGRKRRRGYAVRHDKPQA